MKYISLFFLFLIVCVKLPAQLFKNPLSARVADAYISKFGSFYYLVGTPCPGDWNMQWVGIWKSRDLITWSGPYPAFEGDYRDIPMWASEIYHKGGDYYIITSCNTWEAGATMLLQKAPTPLGPYTFHARLKKAGLDPSLFVDTNGESYLLDSEYIAPLSQDWTVVTGPFVGHPENKEGPFLLKNNNQYMRFFARIEEGYPMELEVANENTPYTDQYSRIGDNGVYIGTNDPGHGCVTVSPDGTELWVASHFTVGSWTNRWLALGKIFFDSKGKPVPTIRSNEWQLVPSFSVFNTNMSVGKLANSSSYMSENSPIKAIDNDLNTVWQVDLAEPDNYLEVDLMGEFEIKKVKLNFGQRAAYRYKIVGSYDRINWTLLGETEHQDLVDRSETVIKKGYYRFIRVINCFAPALEKLEISELQIYNKMDHFMNGSLSERVKNGVLQSTGYSSGISVVDCSLGGKNFSGAKKGDKIDFSKCYLPQTGYYDIVFKVASKNYIFNRWTLYDNGRKVSSEAIGTTGNTQYWANIISFDCYLQAGEHELQLVIEEGEVELESIEFVYLVQEDRTAAETRLPKDRIEEQQEKGDFLAKNVATHKSILQALNDSAYRAVDGNILSTWSVPASIEEDVLVLDLEREVDINNISILFAYPAAYRFTILGSKDGEKWESIYQQYTTTKLSTMYSGGKGVFRYIKLSKLKVDTLQKISIKEIMVTEK